MLIFISYFPQADRTELMTARDVAITVETMVAYNNNTLNSALAAKLDTSARYTDDDARRVVNTMVTQPASDTNLLRAALDSIDERLSDAEDELEGSCGRHCRAGEYVAQICTAEQDTVCAPCPDNTFSVGGLTQSCIPCAR